MSRKSFLFPDMYSSFSTLLEAFAINLMRIRQQTNKKTIITTYMEFFGACIASKNIQCHISRVCINKKVIPTLAVSPHWALQHLKEVFSTFWHVQHSLTLSHKLSQKVNYGNQPTIHFWQKSKTKQRKHKKLSSISCNPVTKLTIISPKHYSTGAVKAGTK